MWVADDFTLQVYFRQEHSIDHIANAGRAVINAAESGAPFPLKRRDQLLDYILTLMGRDDNDDWSETSLELLHTQVS